jgi:hypothetical protein
VNTCHRGASKIERNPVRSLMVDGFSHSLPRSHAKPSCDTTGKNRNNVYTLNPFCPCNVLLPMLCHSLENGNPGSLENLCFCRNHSGKTGQNTPPGGKTVIKKHMNRGIPRGYGMPLCHGHSEWITTRTDLAPSPSALLHFLA